MKGISELAGILEQKGGGMSNFQEIALADDLISLMSLNPHNVFVPELETNKISTSLKTVSEHCHKVPHYSVTFAWEWKAINTGLRLYVLQAFS